MKIFEDYCIGEWLDALLVKAPTKRARSAKKPMLAIVRNGTAVMGLSAGMLVSIGSLASELPLSMETRGAQMPWQSQETFQATPYDDIYEDLSPELLSAMGKRLNELPEFVGDGVEPPEPFL